MAAAAHVTVGGEKCSLFNDELYAKLRTQLGYDSWALQALQSFDFAKLAVRARAPSPRAPCSGAADRCLCVWRARGGAGSGAFPSVR